MNNLINHRSIQINHGYKINTSDIFKWIKEHLHPMVSTSYEKNVYTLVFKEIFDHIEYHTASFSTTKTVFASTAEAWRKRQKEYGVHHTLNDPLRFNLSFGSTNSEKILAIAFIGKDQYGKEYIKGLESLPNVEEYSVNQFIEESDNAQRIEWETRQNDWLNLYDDKECFSHLLSYSAIFKDPFTYWKSYTENTQLNPFDYQPEPYELLKTHFVHTLSNRIIREHKKLFILDDPSDFTGFSKLMRITENHVNFLIDNKGIDYLGNLPDKLSTLEEFYLLSGNFEHIPSHLVPTANIENLENSVVDIIQQVHNEN